MCTPMNLMSGLPHTDPECPFYKSPEDRTLLEQQVQNRRREPVTKKTDAQLLEDSANGMGVHYVVEMTIGFYADNEEDALRIIERMSDDVFSLPYVSGLGALKPYEEEWE